MAFLGAAALEDLRDSSRNGIVLEYTGRRKSRSNLETHARRYNCGVRRLIINADDFGLTEGVNRAIVEAHSEGVVTSTTLMANGPAFDNAVRLAAISPKLSVGCHLVLIDGSPVLERSQVSTLVAPHSTNGAYFRDRLSSFAANALLGRIDTEQIEAEAK